MLREVDGRTGKEDKCSGRRGGRGSRRGRWRENGDEVDGGGGCEDGMERRYERGVCLVGFSDFEKPLVVFSIMSIIYELTGDGSEMVFPENTNRMYSVVGAKFSDSGFSYLGQALNGSITVSFILYAKFGLVLPYGTRLHFPFIGMQS
nr:hypothetical protein Iba_chr06eCG11010 [Ipomoea batatas]